MKILQNISLLFTPFIIVNREPDFVHKYDETIPAVYSALHIYHIESSIVGNNYEITTQYYINTEEETNVNFSVNSNYELKTYKNSAARQNLSQTTIKIPAIPQNNVQEIEVFIESSNYKTRIVAGFNYDENTIQELTLSEKNTYTYKVVKGIKWDNNDNKFVYTFEEIKINLNTDKINNYIYNDNLVIVSGNNIISKINLLYEGIILTSSENSLFIESQLRPGKYKIEMEITYENKAISKTFLLNFEFDVIKNFTGSCANSYICLEAGGVKVGIIQETNKFNIKL